MIFRRLVKRLCVVTGIPEYWVKLSITEARMLFVRLYSILPFQRHKLKHIYAAKQHINLIFGCGETSYPGWIGIDSVFSDNVDFVLDLRRKLPFISNSVDLCYSEHFIEHLWQKELYFHLNEILRVLKPGGRYRIVVPAAFRFINRYLNDDEEFFKLAFPWALRPIDAVRDILYFAGDHKNLFDVNELRYIGEQAGFIKVLESSANRSEIEILRIDKSDPQRVAESLYVEMIKSK